MLDIHNTLSKAYQPNEATWKLEHRLKKKAYFRTEHYRFHQTKFAYLLFWKKKKHLKRDVNTIEGSMTEKRIMNTSSPFLTNPILLIFSRTEA